MARKYMIFIVIALILPLFIPPYPYYLFVMTMYELTINPGIVNILTPYQILTMRILLVLGVIWVTALILFYFQLLFKNRS